MQLIIPATSVGPSLEPLTRRRPFTLLPVLGKPLVEYHLEFAGSIGAKRVVVMADDRPEQVRDLTRQGQAWGLEVEVVAVPPGLAVHEQLARLQIAGDAWLLAADALVPPAEGDRDTRSAPEQDWMDPGGWVLVRRPQDAPPGWDPVAGDGARVLPDRRLRDAKRYVEVQLAMLRDPASFVLPGWEASPGIRISRGCSVSLAAVVDTPVLVCANARVSDRAELGPDVVVGPGCFVDDEASLKRSVVLPRTYVGRLIAGDNLILDGPLIINAATCTTAGIDDDLLLGDLDRPLLGGRVQRAVERLAAMILLVLSSPFFLAAWLASSGRILIRRAYGAHARLTVDGRVERVLVDVHEFDTRSVMLRRLGWLLDVAAGRLALAGTPPLEPERAAAVDPALRDRWLEVPAGMFGVAQLETLRAGGVLDADSEAAAAALHASNPGSTVGHVMRGLGQVLSMKAWRAEQP